MKKKCWKNIKKILIFLNLFLLFQNDHKIFFTKSCIQIRWLIWHPVWGSMASSCWGYQYVTSLVVSLPTSTWEQQIMVPFFHCGLVLKNILGLNHLKQKWLIWPNLSVEKLCFGSKLVMTKSPLFYLVGPRLMGTCTTCMALHTKYQTHMGAYNHFLATYVPILKKITKILHFSNDVFLHYWYDISIKDTHITF